MSRPSRESLALGARPSSLLLQNRRARTAGTDGLDLLSMSGRRPSFPIVASVTAASSSPQEEGKEKEDAPQAVTMQIESSMQMDDLMPSADMGAPKNEHDCSPPVEHSADTSEYAAFKWRCSFDECAYQTLADGWLVTPPETPHNCVARTGDHHLPQEQKNSSAHPASANKPSKIHEPKSGPVTSNSTKRPSISSTTSSNPSNRPSTPNRVPAAARPSTPSRVPAPARPSTPNRVPAPARPSTPDRVSSPARATPNRLPATNRPSTPNQLPARNRPSTPNRTSAPARPSTPNRISAPVKPSTPNKPSATARPESPNRLPTSAVSSTSTRSSVPGRASTPNRPSTPTSKKATSVSKTSQQEASLPHQVTPRPSTPGKPRPLSTSGEQSHPAQSSRPSRPSSQPQNTANLNLGNRTSAAPSSSQVPTSSNKNLNPSNPRSSSRTSTPTRKIPTPSSASAAPRSTSAGRFPTSSARNPAVTRVNSPEPQRTAPGQPIIPFDFPLDVPPNLRTKVPDRPASAGRTRPGSKLTVGANLNSEPSPPTNLTKKQSPSPVTSRGRLHEKSPNTLNRGNGYREAPSGMERTATEGALKKTSKTVAAAESNGPGRALTRKSLDMALKKLDIRKGTGGMRGMSLFPHSIRAATARSSPAESSGILTPNSSNETDTEDTSWNDTASVSTIANDAISENSDIATSYPHEAVLVARITEPDLYESYGYSSILLKEDGKNLSWLSNGGTDVDLMKEDGFLEEGAKDTEWLHCANNDEDQSQIFESRFEPLPEPFDLM